MKIYCCNCKKEIDAVMINGSAAYRNRHDLCVLSFWQCTVCKSFVGTHKTKDKMFHPLGCIATPEIKKARMNLHAIIDPLWKNKKIGRKKLYEMISEFLGYEYHTAETKNLDEIKTVEQFILKISKKLNQKPKRL